MKIPVKPWLSCLATALLVIGADASALGAGKPHYLVTNDDVPPALATSVTFYAVGSSGLLTMKAKVLAGRGGIAGGYFAANRVSVLNSGNAECVYASQALSGEIARNRRQDSRNWWPCGWLQQGYRRLERHRLGNERQIPICQLHRLKHDRNFSSAAGLQHKVCWRHFC